MDEVAEVLSVSQVNRSVKNLIETNLDNLWVLGEIASWTRASSGHCYFTMKDESSQIRCVMFKSDVSKLPVDPDVGMVVRIFGSLGLYEPRGEYQVIVRSLLDEGGEGIWRVAAEKLRKKLQGEGLLDRERKQPLPESINTVGVVTSLGGAALYDILKVIERRSPWTEVIVRDARVQGDKAVEEISEGVKILSESGMVDVLIVARGGGSMEDLWAFNEESVVRAISSSVVPVISAVGHEIDTTLADLVADWRAPTPSAGAEMAVKDGEVLKDQLKMKMESIFLSMKGLLAGLRIQMDKANAQFIGFEDVIVDPIRQSIGRTADELESGIQLVMAGARKDVASVASVMDALSPLGTLTRGYALPRDPQGKILRKVEDIPAGTRFSLKVANGVVGCESLGVEASD